MTTTTCYVIIEAMTKEDFSNFKKLIDTSLKGFWDNVLEPAFNRIEERFDGVDKRFNKVEGRLDGVEERLGSVETGINSVENTLESVDRRLDAEISYRDRLEKRVVRVESKLDLPHEPPRS